MKEKKVVNIDASDFQLVIMCAFTYAFKQGNKPVEESVIRSIKDNYELFDPFVIRNMIELMNTGERLRKTFSLKPMSEEFGEWLKFRDWLEEKLDERKD